MKQQIEAVYEHGVFRPTMPIQIGEGQKCRLSVEPLPVETRDEILELAYQVYDGLTPEQVQEVESIALDRSRFFEDPKP